MFKLTESENQVRTLSEVSVEGYETIQANATVPKGHRLWTTYEAWLALGNTPEPYDNRTSTEKLQATQRELTQAVQRHMDETAQLRGYDNILSLASYATSGNPTFSVEGQAGVEWRDSVWAYSYEQLAAVGRGERGIPTAAELVYELPVMVWPA